MFCTSEFGVVTPQLGDSYTPPGFKGSTGHNFRNWLLENGLLEKLTIKAVKGDPTLPLSQLSLNSPFQGNVSQFRECIFWSMREVNWNEARQDAATSLFF